MKRSRLICAAMAALMTATTAATVTCSADFISAGGGETAAVTEEASQKTYKEADFEKFKEEYAANLRDNYYDEETVEKYVSMLKVTPDGLIYSREDGYCDVMTYIGSGTDLVIPKMINGLTVSYFGCYYQEGIEEPIYYMNDIDIIRTLDIQANIEWIPDVFRNCKALAKVTIPETVRYVDKYAFADTPYRNAIEEQEPMVIIGHTLLEVDADRVEGKVVVPKGVITVQDTAFWKADKVTEIVFPNTVESVGEHVFNYCDSLEKINFGTGVTYVNTYLLKEYTPKLKKVVLSPCITEKSLIWMINGDVDRCRPDKNFDNLDITYYYYRKTAAAGLLGDKRYKAVKRSVLPGKTRSVKVTAKKKSATVKWKAVSTASGYEVQISPDKKFKKSVRSAALSGKSNSSRKFKNLKKGRTYFVRMRTYRTVAGKKYYGYYTKARKFTVR